ncbi:MAG: hypothetical protein KA260_11585, partial [Burkholderiales bacterium]|nr:hypothetical protein [Burkholderiales bacterium]
SNPTLQSTTRYYEGLTARIVDALNKESRKIVDVTGGVRRIQDHDGYQQNFGNDAAGSVLSVTDSLSNALMSATYDYGTEAFRRTSTDSDMGSWVYTYNALGEMTAHTDAKNQSFATTYDALSRPLTRRDGVNGGGQETLTTWTWGNNAASFNIGKLASVSTVATSTYTETNTFDNKSRLSQKSSFNSADGGGTTHNFNYTYNSTTGLLETVQYPTSTSSYRLKLLYTYQSGHLLNIKDFAAQCVNCVDRSAVIDVERIHPNVDHNQLPTRAVYVAQIDFLRRHAGRGLAPIRHPRAVEQLRINLLLRFGA